MQTLPNIVPAELFVVSAAVLVLCLAPALVSWADHRRKYRSFADAPRFDSGEATPQSVASIEQFPVGAAGQGIETPARVEEEATPQSPSDQPYPVDVRAAELLPETRSEEPAAHHFRLQDLRRVRLRDWPPPAVRNDPERHRVWHEAEGLAEEHESAINLTVLSSSFPAQSACLGAAEVEGSKLRLRFLLFPVLWPAQEEQAHAEAIFEVDRSAGAVHSWVQARLKD